VRKTKKPHGFATRLTNYGDKDFSVYLRRSFAKSMGYTIESLSKPTIGITNTTSGLNNCHRHFPELIESIKRGVLAAGGLPVEFPTISLGEVFLSPTSMKFRNLMSMDVEEMIRAQPIDSVVLLGGCDKTVPALLIGAISADYPAVQLVAGPMMTGRFEGERLGACTDCRRFWAKFRAGEIDKEKIEQIEGNLAARVDDPNLDIKADDIMVLQNAGPQSESCMPEAGYLPIPIKLAKQGVKDMIRISDARMSGTAFGTIILHVSPEACIGGPLALVKNGDLIHLSVKEKKIDLLVEPDELDRRRKEPGLSIESHRAKADRGYSILYRDHVLQADEGCDFDFLTSEK
jgi:dihydroxyacid dehydratase/phosphogluconate dehydratase